MPQVAHCQAFESFEENEVLRLAACVERESSHPLAAAIVGSAAGRGLDISAAADSSISIPGQVGQNCTSVVSAQRLRSLVAHPPAA